MDVHDVEAAGEYHLAAVPGRAVADAGPQAGRRGSTRPGSVDGKRFVRSRVIGRYRRDDLDLMTLIVLGIRQSVDLSFDATQSGQVAIGDVRDPHDWAAPIRARCLRNSRATGTRLTRMTPAVIGSM